ncbi:hypothetical protein LTR08_003381 [Meristemomyces frigidus]|nr:hypothetical protein LTR08_003381 [Meristemomyces frigidus]
MRNLRNTAHRSLGFRPDNPITALAHDLDSLILAFGPNEANPSITLKRLAEDADNPHAAETITSWDAVATDEILSLHSSADTQSLCLVLSHGDIVVVRQDPQPDEEPIEIVGSVDAGIAAAAWSPDEELLLIATKADTVLFMTTDFEPIANVTLSDSDVNVSNHVSVGWGKKETQFKGRGAAKALRDPTMPEFVDQGSLGAYDDGQGVTVSWRGDGEVVVVNSVLGTGEGRRRVIRVYSREGVLESVSEAVDGLEAALSWKPSGQVLAGVQRRGDGGLSVVFFERNGLRHGEFDLRLSKEEADGFGRGVELRWNGDSTVLAVAMRDRVQLWTMGNYHYYLKQEIRFNSSGGVGDGLKTTWHPERPLQLACSNGEELRTLSYCFAVSRGSVDPPSDVGLVAVVDGKTLQITPLRVANVPPPMSLDEIEVATAITDVSFNEAGTEVLVRHGTQLSKFTCDYMTKPMRKAVLHTVEDLSPLQLEESEHAAQVGEGDFTLAENGVLHRAGTPLPIRCTSFVATTSHLIYTTSNHLLKFVHLPPNNEEPLRIPLTELEKDERCRNIERGARIITVIPSTHALVLQMPRGNLETIYPRALVLAGIRRSLAARQYGKAFMTCRTHRVDMNILCDYAPEQFLGDVEVFLKQVGKVEWVDLFLSSLAEENVAETIYRETRGTGLEEPLVNGPMGGARDGSGKPTVSKVNRICDAVLASLRSQASPSLQNVITAHVCRSPPDLEAGLSLVSDLRRQQKTAELQAAVEHICFLADVNRLYDTALGLYDLDVALLVAQQSQKDPREYLPYLQGLKDLSPALRQQYTIDDDLKRYRKALAHLHGLAEFEELKAYVAKHDLYGAAIELYRYDSARLAELMRLYAAFLASRNRYKEAGIAHEYVRDYTSAYEAYRAASLWQECLAAAELVPLPEDELRALAQDLAAALEEAKEFAAAATVHLEYLDELEGAAKLLCKGYDFVEAMRVLARHKKPDLLKTVIDPGLIEASASMTELLAEMKGQLQAQIPRLRELRQKRADDPMGFLEGGGGGGDGEEGDIPDNLSLAATDTTAGATFMTRYTDRSTGTLGTNATRKTSKNRRREERKRARGKKGTVYEEEYLVNSVARLIERLNGVVGDLARLVEGLMRRAMRERAVAVEAAAVEVVEACRGCMDEVFAVAQQGGGKREEHHGVEEAGGRPTGGEGVLYEALAASEQKREAPVLKAFERLSLLS